MEKIVQDMRGNDLAVGDTIVYPFSSGSSGYLRIGVIKEFIVKKEKYGSGWNEKIKVEWQDTKETYDHVTQTRGTKPYIWTSLIQYPKSSLKLS
jgi:hypothetical protein